MPDVPYFCNIPIELQIYYLKREKHETDFNCLRHNITVIADEIHCEPVSDGYTYTLFASLPEDFAAHSVTCTSPIKAFHLAGLQIANIICANADRRTLIYKSPNINELYNINPFGVEALIAFIRMERNSRKNSDGILQ